MKEYGSDWGGHDYKEDKNDKEIKKEIDKEVDVDREYKTDYDPFKFPDYDKTDLDYDPFKCPDYDKTDLDLISKEMSSIEEIKEDIIKENEPEFTEKKAIDHEITFDNIYEKELEEIVKDIKKAEEFHAIYAEDIMIPTNDKEAMEKYYLEKMRDEGVIITNDLYFENVHDNEQTIVDFTNEIKETITDLDHEKIDEDAHQEVKLNITEIDAKQIELVNNVHYNNNIHEPMVEVKEFSENNEEIKIQEDLENEILKSDMKDPLYSDKEQEIKDEYSSRQYLSQILNQETKELPHKEPQEIQEEIHNEAEEKYQPEVKELLNQDIRNEIDKKEITKEIEENHVKSSDGKEITDIPLEKINLDYKNNEQEPEIKEAKREPIDKDFDFKEEWEEIIVEWIKEVPEEKVSYEKKEELVEIIKKYHDVRKDYKCYFYLKHEKEEISEDEREQLEDLAQTFKETDEKEVEMFKELNAFRHFYDYNKTRWYDSVINSRKEKYPELLVEKLRRLKHEEFDEKQDPQYQESQEQSAEINIENYEQLKERYKRETGERVIYGGNETKGFKSWKEGLNERQEESYEEFSKDSHEIREEWADSLKNHIHDVSDEEISKDIKEQLTYVIENYGTLKKIAKKLPPNFNQLIEDLKQFQATYDVYKERGYEKSIPREVGKVAKKLEKRLVLMKNDALLNAILNKEITTIQNIKVNIKENIYLSTELTMNEKSKIIKIIQKENLKDEDKKEIISLLSNLSSEELKSLLGKNYEKYVQNFINDLNSDESITSFISNYTQQFKNPEEKIKIRIPHFKQKLIENLKNLHRLIDGTTDQKKFMWSKALEILDEFISRVKNNEFYIPKDANLKVIASTIIYTVIISNKNMPKISGRQIAKMVNIKAPNYITKYYKKHFEHLYPRKEFRFASYDFRRIRQILSLYFFKLIRNTEIETFELVIRLRENIEKNINLPEQLTQKDINRLREMAAQYQDIFIKYFSDLAEIIKQLIISSNVHKKIGAHIVIKFLADFLEEKEVNLFQASEVFYRSVKEIFDSLREIFPNYFPSRVHTQEKESDYEYRKIIGSKLKLFVIKHIYDGKYFENGNIKCSECLKEELIINTDISRLEALEFHHEGDEKEKEFTADELYEYFVKNRSNPLVLEDLVKLMESEEVILVCRNHHFILHDGYYNYFKYLINWDQIFSLSSELIHIIIMTAVNNFNKTKNLPPKNRQYIRGKIVRKLKKKYIIELLYGEFCPTCGEINTRKHLPAFIYNHIDDEIKTINASDLFTQILPCSEIARTLKHEKGGYICPNCHTVFHYKNFHLLNEIYGDKNIVKKVLDDYNRVRKKFKLIQDINLIKNPLKKSEIITENIERYLTAIYEISESGREVTNRDLRDSSGLSRQTISEFFKTSDIIKKYVDIVTGTPPTPTKYILNSRGRNAVSLIFHFRDYYMNKN